MILSFQLITFITVDTLIVDSLRWQLAVTAHSAINYWQHFVKALV